MTKATPRPSIRRRVKSLIQSSYCNTPPVIVASFGRAGSTVIYDSLVAGMAHSRFFTTAGFAQAIVRDRLFEHEDNELQMGVVYKTHRLPQDIPPSRHAPPKLIFMFGCPLDSVISVKQQVDNRGSNWVNQHFIHLGQPPALDELYLRDALGFISQCKHWLVCESDVLWVRYESLWRNIETIESFVNLKVELPEQRPRQNKIETDENMALLNSVYGELSSHLESLPDIFINKSLPDRDKNSLLAL